MTRARRNREFPDASELAALRAVMEGMSAREAVDRFLADQRTFGSSSRSLISGIRRRLVNIARERHRHDLIELFGAAARSRRARSVAGAIETLRSASMPQPLVTDEVDLWFSPRIAMPMVAAGIETLADVVVRMVASPRWWRKVRGLGRIGASQVDDFVRGHGDLLARANAVTARPTSPLVPWEHLKAPQQLDGSRGAFRAPKATSVLAADTDYAAVQAWLELQESPATRRAYRKEAERLMLWAIVERGKPLSSLTTEDAISYRAFLRKPTPKERWVGSIAARTNAQWRPFQDGLSPRSAAYALQVLGALFRWLIAQRYVLANPLAGVRVRAGTRAAPLDMQRSFTEHEWSLIMSVAQSVELEQTWSEDAIARLKFVLNFSYATGLRAAELAGAVLGDSVERRGDMWLQVRGKGQKEGLVAAPPLAKNALSQYLAYRGLPITVARWDPSTPLIASLAASEAITAGRLWQICKRFFEHAATVLREISPALAEKLGRASPHWMRHTHATHALNFGADVTAVRDNLRHASISTTSTYLHSEETKRARQMAEAFRGVR